jgi:hypothetical protein
MRKIPLLAAAAALSLFAIVPASATVVVGSGLPILTNASDSGVQLAAWKRRWHGNGGGNWGHGGNWHHRNHDHGWNNGGIAFGFGIPSYGYGYPSYGYGYPSYAYGYDDGYDSSYADQGVGDEHVQACLERYRSYDPDSDTFLGNDGMRHRCNVY